MSLSGTFEVLSQSGLAGHNSQKEACDPDNFGLLEQRLRNLYIDHWRERRFDRKLLRTWATSRHAN
jgi:hypothetical protein